ncbi:MAG: hypothetical protein K940chlam9_00888 [Chlamydiae bacterium]|nr:hypothetical protein [Chlamydiota bacterium]
MKKWLLFFLIFATSLYGEELRLKDLLRSAEPGSYFVTEHSQLYTFFYIQDRQDETLFLEEVCIPAKRFVKAKMDWGKWFCEGAKGNTGWLVSQVDLGTGEFLDTFSYAHQGWVDTSDFRHFLSTLLNLPFYPVPENKRQKIGSPPPANRADTRRNWNPRFTYQGETIKNVPFSAWVSHWPRDKSELSGKYLEIYLPEHAEGDGLPNYPTYFPHWIEIEGAVGTAKLRVVDSGYTSCSPQPPMLVS